MAEIERGEAGDVVWAAAYEALAGEDSLGDAFVVRPGPDRVLIAVIDGLGHGRDANHASRAVATALGESAEGSLTEIVRHCHVAANRTRGVVMSIAAVSGDTLEWLGVGNVETALLRADRGAARPIESMMVSGGVIGYQLPTLRARSLPVGRGDLLVMATDGLRADFASKVIRHDAPHLVASRVLRTLRQGADDALVLAARLRPVQS